MPCTIYAGLKKLGFKINGDIVCTMIAAAVTDENRFRYDLNSLSWHYLRLW